MPKQVPEAELAAILNIVAGLPQPASLEEIFSQLELPLPRRTLQRRLALLVAEGRLGALSERAGRRYHPFDGAPMMVAESAPTPQAERDRIPLSAAAREIKRSVVRPLLARRPVGYEGSFLADYVPNDSSYLPRTLRRKLAEMGRTDGQSLPAGTHFRQVLDRLLIDLTWNSSRLEGNTYSLLETQRLLEQGESAEGKATGEAQMILNHKAAIELLADQAGEIGFNRYTLCNLHAALAENLLDDPAGCGRLRSRAVGITGTVFLPLAVPQAIEDQFNQFLSKAAAITDPFEQAFFAMVHIPYLQPFDDVNKRVSRLAANIPLVRGNLSPLSFVDLPRDDYVHGLLGVYELNRVDLLRDVFAWAYARSCARYAAVRQTLGQPDPFRLRHRELLRTAVAGVVRGGMDKKAAASFVRRQAAVLPQTGDRTRFAEVTETELTSLHEGNFARYRLRPAEFAAWQKTWR